jgi:hypothetical protein
MSQLRVTVAFPVCFPCSAPRHRLASARLHCLPCLIKSLSTGLLPKTSSKPSGAPLDPLFLPSTPQTPQSPASISRPTPKTYRATRSSASSRVTPRIASASSSIRPQNNPPHGAPSLSTSTALVKLKPGVHPTHTSNTPSLSSLNATATSTAKLKRHSLP